MSTANGMTGFKPDSLDQIAAKALEGYLVRKDLVRKYSKQFPLPTYVVEFLLGPQTVVLGDDDAVEPHGPGLADELLGHDDAVGRIAPGVHVQVKLHGDVAPRARMDSKRDFMRAASRFAS